MALSQTAPGPVGGGEGGGSEMDKLPFINEWKSHRWSPADLRSDRDSETERDTERDAKVGIETPGQSEASGSGDMSIAKRIRALGRTASMLAPLASVPTDLSAKS